MFGGTFNPPHSGHIAAACSCVEQLHLDKLLLVPTAIPPHKQLPVLTASPSQRLEMAALAATLIPNAEASDIELCRGGASYTKDTLEALHQKYPDDELWLIMGTDMFLTIENWRDPERIFSLASIAVMPRCDGDVDVLTKHSERLAKLYGTVSVVINEKSLTISSTDIRPLIKSGKISEYLPGKVYEYILENKLYGISGSDET